MKPPSSRNSARHGSRQADGNEFGTEVSSVRLVVKEMKRPGFFGSAAASDRVAARSPSRKRREKVRQLLNNNSQSNRLRVCRGCARLVILFEVSAPSG